MSGAGAAVAATCGGRRAEAALAAAAAATRALPRGGQYSSPGPGGPPSFPFEKAAWRVRPRGGARRRRRGSARRGRRQTLVWTSAAPPLPLSPPPSAPRPPQRAPPPCARPHGPPAPPSAPARALVLRRRRPPREGGARGRARALRTGEEGPHALGHGGKVQRPPPLRVLDAGVCPRFKQRFYDLSVLLERSGVQRRPPSAFGRRGAPVAVSVCACRGDPRRAAPHLDSSHSGPPPATGAGQPLRGLPKAPPRRAG